MSAATSVVADGLAVVDGQPAKPVGLPEAAPPSVAAQALFERHGGRVLAFCASRLGSRQEAEDAAQTTFLYALKALHRGVTPRIELAWLLTIAHHVCLNRRRTLARRRRVEASADFSKVEQLVPAPAAVADELVGFPQALSGLCERQRQVLILRELRGYSYRDIGETLGLSQSAVETLLFRARRAVARRLERASAAFALVANGRGLLRVLRRLLTTGSAAKTAAAITVATTVVVTGPRADRPLPNRSSSDARAVQPALLSGAVARPAGQTPTVAVRLRRRPATRPAVTAPRQRAETRSGGLARGVDSADGTRPGTVPEETPAAPAIMGPTGGESAPKLDLPEAVTATPSKVADMGARALRKIKRIAAKAPVQLPAVVPDSPSLAPVLDALPIPDAGESLPAVPVEDETTAQSATPGAVDDVASASPSLTPP